MSGNPDRTTDDADDLDLRDAVRLAKRDERFAAAFLSSPEQFKHIFGLAASELKAVEAAEDVEALVNMLGRSES